MVVVAAWGAAPADERPAAVRGLPGHHVGDVDDVGVLRVHLHLVEVPVAAPQARVGVDEPPALAAVIRPIQSPALRRTHHRAHPPALPRRNAATGPAEPAPTAGPAR